MRGSVSLLFYRVLAVMYDIWTRRIFAHFPPYVLKYNELRFGVESISVFRLIPEHVVTVVLEKVSLKTGTCADIGTWCVVFQHILEKSKKKILGLQNFCIFLSFPYSSLSFSSAPHPHLSSACNSSAGLWRWRVTRWYRHVILCTCSLNKTQKVERWNKYVTCKFCFYLL